jgi:cytochrome c biogenesis protein CcmG, thiol:disulfide interchange protein DsbE
MSGIALPISPEPLDLLNHSHFWERKQMGTLVVTKRQRHLAVGAVALLLAVVVFAATSIRGGEEAAGTSALPAAQFELFDGEQTTLDKFEGRPLVVNFWASWCPACVAELPEFEAAFQEYGDDVAFLGLANADIREAAIRLADDVGLTYTLGDDPGGDLFRAFELIAMPSTIFITADGEIQEIFGGQLNERALGERIDDLIGST